MLGSIVRNNCVSIMFAVTIVMATCEDREIGDPFTSCQQGSRPVLMGIMLLPDPSCLLQEIDVIVITGGLVY